MPDLTPVDLTCGHQRRVDPGIGSLVAAGVIDHMWCIRCATDQPTAAISAATQGV